LEAWEIGNQRGQGLVGLLHGGALFRITSQQVHEQRGERASVLRWDDLA
jgi:hypothetical protein